MTQETGRFVISLDFELLWGILDQENQKNYEKNILGVWEAMPKILNLFDEFNIQCTFAIVGFMFASNKDDMLKFLPKITPKYKQSKYSPYTSKLNPIHLPKYKNELYFAEKLVNLIRSKGNHEIASHTFSHYYCLEEGQSIEEFRADVQSAISIAKSKGININSLIFPRNQYSPEHLEVLSEFGINSYRGNESSWYYKSITTEADKKLHLRLSRLLDNYINLSGHNCYTFEDIKKEFPFNLPSSKFLRPYSSKLKHFDSLRLNRIKKSMSHAAINNKVYHLWWHPHNFGNNLKYNLEFLKKILDHYKYLNKNYSFNSATMNGISEEIKSHLIQ